MRKFIAPALGLALLSLPGVSISTADAQLVTRSNEWQYATGGLKREKHATKSKTQSASKATKAKRARKK